jgi:tRNA(adenine34) deaminase
VSNFKADDLKWMHEALTLAKEAAQHGEVPVGAIIVRENRLIASGRNTREQRQEAVSHAETDAISMACRALSSWRLTGCTLYVTLEPCIMCAGAIYQARLERVVFGAMDPKAGAMGSLYRIHEDTRLNHRLPVEGGILADESSAVLKEFFRARR